jgi:hypothetical protein
MSKHQKLFDLLKKERLRHFESGELLLDEAKSILQTAALKSKKIISATSNSYIVKEFSESKLNDFDKEKCFTEREIQSFCENFRFKMINSFDFSGKIDAITFDKLKWFEEKFQVRINYFKLLIPVELLDTSKDVHPAVFIEISNGKYLLIHNEEVLVNTWRKWLYYPFRNLSALLISIIVLTSLFTILVPADWLVRKESLQKNIYYYRGLFFVSCFVWISVIGLYISLVSNKNLSSANWNKKKELF